MTVINDRIQKIRLQIINFKLKTKKLYPINYKLIVIGKKYFQIEK